MANYIFYENTDENIVNRFASMPANDVSGIETWLKYTSMLIEYLSVTEREKERLREYILKEIERNLSPETYESLRRNNDNYFLPGETEKHILIQLLQELRAIKQKPNRCPRLFISHRSVDWMYALKMGQVAAENKFDYWIDILDVKLINVTNNTSLSEECRVILTACIIEMAIINCTHVITCMTPGTKGSQWVPYEYGRITEIPSHYKKAASWVHPLLQQQDFPDYMYLGEVVQTKREISNWLRVEYIFWSRPTCSVSPDQLKDIELPLLPEDEKDGDEETAGFPYYLYISAAGTSQEILIDTSEREQAQLKEWLYAEKIKSIKQIKKLSVDQQSKEALDKYLRAGMPLTRPVEAPHKASFKRTPPDN